MTEKKSAPCHAYQNGTSTMFFLQLVKYVCFDKIRVSTLLFIYVWIFFLLKSPLCGFCIRLISSSLEL
jgi:hypothetical protein